MTAQDAGQQRETISHGVYGILITVVLVFVLILVVLQLQNNESGRLGQLANKYHLASSETSLKLSGAINNVRLWLRDYDVEAGRLNGSDNTSSVSPSYLKFPRRDRIAAFKFEADKIVDEITRIQKDFADPEFKVISKLLVSSYSGVESDFDMLASDNTSTYENIDTIFAPLITVTHQLHLLHKHAYKKTLRIIEANNALNRKQLTGLIIALTLIGVFGVVKTLRHVRLTLSDLMTTQSELQESERLLKEAQHIACLGYFDWNVVTDDVVCSEEACRIYGFQPDAGLSLQSIVELIDKDDAGRVSLAMKSAVEGGGELNIEYRFTRPGGQGVNVHVKGELTTNEQSKVIRMLGTVIDITERKQAEEALSREEAHMRAIVNSVPDVFVFANTNREIISTNPAVKKLFGYNSEELKGKATNVLYANIEDFNKQGEGRFNQKAKSSTDPYVVRYRRKNGIEFPGETLGAKVIDDNGNLLGFIGIIRDVSDRLAAEEELAQHRVNLEGMVEVRTRELRDAQDELVRKERLSTLGQLTATVSHELRNPLGAMRPSLYVIEKTSDKADERVQVAIQRVGRNIDRCDRIIDELLDFTRIIKLDQTPVLVDEWLESVIDEQDFPAGIRVDKDLSLLGVELAVDTDRLRRAVINVVDNACHAMMDDKKQVVSSDSACVKIKTIASDERIGIMVSDTGSGISDDVLGKIFEPLFSTKGFGVGLGMPAVKQIMEQHDGGVEVESEESKGTTVTLWVPWSACVSRKTHSEKVS